ncbi:MAG: nicotinate phosphoribosyltransferase [Myxococcales bacterium]|nr:nicotinate phosphoribosyltransferase [Myxococcales bacterium]
MGSSLLATDGYKFSMAEAGWPLRVETFHYVHRRGGPQLLPFDVEAEVRKLLPSPAPEEYACLAAHEYEMGAGFKAAIVRSEGLCIQALPKGAAFLPREPVFSVTGPSALVSWLEPLVLQLNYRIQVATLALTSPERLEAELGTVTCDEQRSVALEALEAVGVRPPRISVDSGGYRSRVRERAGGLVGLVGDGRRVFEVGMRAATCASQHRLALEGCREAGVVKTSNVLLARELGMVPVGTMGHEHVQRYGSDEGAFRAMRERRPQRSSYLLDTFDTVRSGIPTALKLIAEEPGRGDSIRYDSGDKVAQYLHAASLAKERGIRPVQILEDGFDATQTRRFEELRQQVGWRPEEQFYGYGGYLVAATMGGSLTRDRVAAVYKLSQTGSRPTMKFGDEAGSGKQSVPGRPVLFRRLSGDGPYGVIGQEGEVPPKGYCLLTGSATEPASFDLARRIPPEHLTVALSPATQALVEAIRLQSFGGPR